MQRLLAVSGFHVVAFGSVQELVESGKWKTADCIIMDVRLGQASGFDLYRRLLSNGLRAPVVFVTAYDDPAVRAEALALGAAAYLAKPFAEGCLATTVKRAIGHDLASGPPAA
jgi:FixJ family two-component response regulator